MSDLAGLLRLRSSRCCRCRGVTSASAASQALEGRLARRPMPGEVHCLLGENGAGKSTLCNLIFGVHRPDAGDMRFGGAPFAPAGPADALAQGIAMVHQHFSLVPRHDAWSRT